MRSHSPTQRLDDEAIGAHVVGGDDHRVRAFPGGRVCGHEGCSVLLSVYNQGTTCALHHRHEADLASATLDAYLAPPGGVTPRPGRPRHAGGASSA